MPKKLSDPVKKVGTTKDPAWPNNGRKLSWGESPAPTKVTIIPASKKIPILPHIGVK